MFRSEAKWKWAVIFLSVLSAFCLLKETPSVAEGKLDQSAPTDQEGVKGPRRRNRPADVPLAHAVIKHDEPTAEEKILETFDKPTTVDWSELPFEEVLAFLADHHKVPIIVDRASLKEQEVSVDSPITLSLNNVSFRSVLQLVLEPLELEWVIRHEVLVITTRAWCEAHPEVHVYEIKTLIDAGHDPDELIRSIVACIEPMSWSIQDGYAGISHTGGVLFVRQTQRAQSQIADLLDQLDEIAEQEAEDARGREKSMVATLKVYPTGDQPAEKIAEALQDFVVQSTWKKTGGAGEVLALQGRLVVKQSPRGHLAVAKFLSQVAGEKKANMPRVAPNGAPQGGESSK